MSHPSWVRGLKLLSVPRCSTRCSSHPSWVRGLKLIAQMLYRLFLVAPLVGAWIETSSRDVVVRGRASHPSWVRGLKHVQQVLSYRDSPSHPSWVRGLKPKI